MKKSSVVILSVILVVVSSLLTYFVTTSIQVETGDKVVVSKEYYSKYSELKEKYADIEELKTYITKNFYKDVTEKQLIEGMKKGLFSILEDPYSVYMNQEEFDAFVESTSGQYPGVGAYLAPNDQLQIEIVTPIDGSPALEAGIQAKDVIVKVDGVEYSSEQMEEAIRHIKGEPGTSVTLTIFRPESKELFDVEIVREWIVINSVKVEMLDQTVGYLRLSSFDSKSAQEFRKGMDDLIDNGAEGIIVDLRNNPGGSLDQCVKIADMLMPKGLIVYTEGRNGENQKYYSDDAHYDVAMTLLVDGGSASASEILTGALKDTSRATVIGLKTFGKGIVQAFRAFGTTDGIKLTISEYFTPNGINIHKVGIEPDIMIAPQKGAIQGDMETDNQLMKAIEVIKAQLAE